MDFKLAIDAHEHCRAGLLAAIESRSPVDGAAVARDDCCAVGRWLYGDARVRYGALVSHPACVRAHAEFHRQAGEIVRALREQRDSDARALLDPRGPCCLASGALIGAILALRREAHHGARNHEERTDSRALSADATDRCEAAVAVQWLAAEISTCSDPA